MLCCLGRSAEEVIEYCRLMMFLRAEEKRGLSQEKRGSPGAKAALQISLHRTEEKPLTRPTAILEERRQ